MTDRTVPTEPTWLLKQGATPEQALERIAQRIAVWRDADPDEDESWESFYSAAFDMLSAEVGGIISAVVQPLAASPAAPGAEVEPVALGPRPCDCDRCYCGNVGDAEAVAAWDERAALARTTDAIKAQARREALEALSWALDEIDTLSNKLSGFAYPQGMAFANREAQAAAYTRAVEMRRALAGKPGEAE